MNPTASTLWSSIQDRASASYVARMAGLPTFLSGLLGGVSSGLLLFSDPSLAEYWGVLLMSLFLLWASLRIRRGRFGLLPVVAALVVLDLSLRLLDPISYRIAVPLILALFVLNGLRGWWWLRRHPDAGE